MMHGQKNIKLANVCKLEENLAKIFPC